MSSTSDTGEAGRASVPGTLTPEFAVLGVEVAEDAAAPTLRFRLVVSEPTEREIFTIALTAQINIEPARREYDAETRERLVDLFGEPERWPATTHALLWTHATTLVPSFSGAFSANATFTVRMRVSVGRLGSCGFSLRIVTESAISSTVPCHDWPGKPSAVIVTGARSVIADASASSASASMRNRDRSAIV